MFSFSLTVREYRQGVFFEGKVKILTYFLI